MPVNAETQKALMGVVENLGTAKFGLGESETVGVQEIINDNSDNPSYICPLRCTFRGGTQRLHDRWGHHQG
eukprot:scaffold19821_cov166-Skeletonema_marinoi.AAC.1